MPNIKIQIPKLDIELLDMEETKAHLERLANSMLKSELHKVFSGPQYTHAGSRDNGGEGYRMIKDLVEKLTMDDNFNRQIAELVETRFNEVLASTVQSALDHIVRGRAFPEAVRLATEAAQAKK